MGTLRADLSASRADFAAVGGAARLQYRYMDTVAGDIHSWTAVTTYRSPTFTALGDRVASNPYALELGLVYSRRLLWNLLGTLGLGRQMGRAGQPDGATTDLTLHRSFGRELLAVLAFSRRYPVANQTENRVLMSLAWHFSGLDTVTASQDSATGASRLQWHHCAPRRVRSVDSDILLTRDRLSDTSQGELHYRDYLFRADAVGSFVQDRAPGSSTSAR